MIKIISVILTMLVVGCNCDCINSPTVNSNVIVPTTVERPEVVNSFTPQRLIDLSRIVDALERYKRDNRRYPISSGSGLTWDSLFLESVDGSNENWIDGLVPQYIESLPRDPRKNNLFDQQYRYRSNGANYKLISLQPDDCELVKAKLPNIIYHLGDCWAYGYWTAGAAGW